MNVFVKIFVTFLSVLHCGAPSCGREFNYSRDNVFVCGGRSPLCAACTTNTQSVGWPEPCRHLSRGCTFWEADEAALAEHQGLVH